MFVIIFIVHVYYDGRMYIISFTGEIHTTGNITVWPDYPSSSHVIEVEVSNSASCQYTSRCYMGFTVDFTNWVPKFFIFSNDYI